MKTENEEKAKKKVTAMEVHIKRHLSLQFLVCCITNKLDTAARKHSVVCYMQLHNLNPTKQSCIVLEDVTFGLGKLLYKPQYTL